MDRLEAARQIGRRWACAERPRIIAVTANALQGGREACLAAGMDAYVSKSIRPEELGAALREARPRTPLACEADCGRSGLGGGGAALEHGRAQAAAPGPQARWEAPMTTADASGPAARHDPAQGGQACPTKR